MNNVQDNQGTERYPTRHESRNGGQACVNFYPSVKSCYSNHRMTNETKQQDTVGDGLLAVVAQQSSIQNDTTDPLVSLIRSLQEISIIRNQSPTNKNDNDHHHHHHHHDHQHYHQAMSTTSSASNSVTNTDTNSSPKQSPKAWQSRNQVCRTLRTKFTLPHAYMAISFGNFQCLH